MARPKKLNSVETHKAQEKLPSDIAEFLAGGGKIERIEIGVTGYGKNHYGRNKYQKETK